MMPSRFAQALTERCAAAPGSHVLAAVSGGADSVALLCLLCEVQKQLGISVSCAHVEHGIRGGASLADMHFVRMLCKQKNIPFYARRVDVPAYAASNGLGFEDAARILRRAALREIAAEIGADTIALAHHAMDQAETVLLHAARGSDVRGLCAMRWRTGLLIRPLLGAQPQELRAYLKGIGQSWREDETNLDVTFARNRMRHEVLPALEKAYPGAVNALCRLAAAAQRDEKHFDRLLDDLSIGRKVLVDGVALDREMLAGLDGALIGRLLERELTGHGFGIQDYQVITQLSQAVTDGRNATVNLSGGAHAYVEGRFVCLIRRQELPQDTPISMSGQTKTPYGVFCVRPAFDGETGDGVTSQAIDENLLSGAVVSHRREGDMMIPFGRKSPVKLKKLMIDAGVMRPIRNSVPVIRRTGNENDILWAVGLRPSALCAPRGGRRLMLEYKCME